MNRSERNYVSGGGVRCMHCGSDRINTQGGYYCAGDGAVQCKVGCDCCGESWVDEYKLSKVLKLGDVFPEEKMEVEKRKLLMCNGYDESQCLKSCPHHQPHEYIPLADRPACTDEGTYCYYLKKFVNCVDCGETDG